MEWFTWKRTAIMVCIAWLFTAAILILPMTGNWGKIAKAGCLFNYTIGGFPTSSELLTKLFLTNMIK